MIEFFRKLKGELLGKTTVNVEGWLGLKNIDNEVYGLKRFYDEETNTLYIDKLQSHLIWSNTRYLDKNYYEKLENDHWKYLKKIMVEPDDYKELFELRSENYSLRNDLKDLENSKQNYQNKIHDKNCKILELEDTINQIKKQNSKIKDLKIELKEKDKKLKNLQIDFNFFVYEYQKLKGIKEDFARTYDEYIDKIRISYDLDAEESVEDIKLMYERIISELKRENDNLTDSNKRLNSEKSSKVKRLEKENNSFMISLKEKNAKIEEQKNEISKLKNSKNNKPKKQERELSKIEVHKVSRESKEYARYKKSVLKRDKICQCCGSPNNREVHHPLAFNAYNHLGADTNNGIVLCKDCHVEYHHKYGYKQNNNPVTLAQFLRDYGIRLQSTFDDEYLVSEDLIRLAGGK